MSEVSTGSENIFFCLQWVWEGNFQCKMPSRASLHICQVTIEGRFLSTNCKAASINFWMVRIIGKLSFPLPWHAILYLYCWAQSSIWGQSQREHFLSLGRMAVIFEQWTASCVNNTQLLTKETLGHNSILVFQESV